MTPARNVNFSTWHNGFYGESFTFTADNAGTPVDLTSYSGKLQARLYGAQKGPPIISLPNVASAIEGVWIAEPSQGVVDVRINETTLRNAYWLLKGSVEPGDSVELICDLVLTNPSGADEVWATGTFTINAGSTL